MTAKDTRRVRVIIPQFAPGYLDKAASVAKAIHLLQRAKRRGADLV